MAELRFYLGLLHGRGGSTGGAVDADLTHADPIASTTEAVGPTDEPTVEDLHDECPQPLGLGGSGGDYLGASFGGGADLGSSLSSSRRSSSDFSSGFSRGVPGELGPDDDASDNAAAAPGSGGPRAGIWDVDLGVWEGEGGDGREEAVGGREEGAGGSATASTTQWGGLDARRWAVRGALGQADEAAGSEEGYGEGLGEEAGGVGGLGEGGMGLNWPDGAGGGPLLVESWGPALFGPDPNVVSREDQEGEEEGRWEGVRDGDNGDYCSGEEPEGTGGGGSAAGRGWRQLASAAVAAAAAAEEGRPEGAERGGEDGDGEGGAATDGVGGGDSEEEEEGCGDATAHGGTTVEGAVPVGAGGGSSSGGTGSRRTSSCSGLRRDGATGGGDGASAPCTLAHVGTACCDPAAATAGPPLLPGTSQAAPDPGPGSDAASATASAGVLRSPSLVGGGGQAASSSGDAGGPAGSPAGSPAGCDGSRTQPLDVGRLPPELHQAAAPAVPAVPADLGTVLEQLRLLRATIDSARRVLAHGTAVTAKGAASRRGGGGGSVASGHGAAPIGGGSGSGASGPSRPVVAG